MQMGISYRDRKRGMGERCLELQRGQEIYKNKKTKNIARKEVKRIVKHNQNHALKRTMKSII